MENEETDAGAVEHLEEEMEDTLHEMEGDEKHLDEGIEETKENWEKARRDKGVPGAEPPEPGEGDGK